MSRSLDQLINGQPGLPASKKMGRPTKAEAAEKAARLAPLPHKAEFWKPVGVSFLAEILHKQPKQIEKRLAKCPVVFYEMVSGKEQPRYDFLTAMSFLIPPRGDIEDYLTQNNQASLPPSVSKWYWEMVNARIRALIGAGKLWHDDDVLITLARVANVIRESMKRWVEDLPGRETLDNEQYQFLVTQTRSLQEEIKERLEDMPRQYQTLSMAHTVASEIEAADQRPSIDLADDFDA